MCDSILNLQSENVDSQTTPQDKSNPSISENKAVESVSKAEQKQGFKRVIICKKSVSNES